ncbi:hypothetical protein [Plantactinospora sp. WMMB782]|uniref:hypothetical protein n=1 Tax=Plantactinospora sp. WMMB782 TaxID=3404121 RepID=UPI003B952EA2
MNPIDCLVVGLVLVLLGVVAAVLGWWWPACWLTVGCGVGLLFDGAGDLDRLQQRSGDPR